MQAKKTSRLLIFSSLLITGVVAFYLWNPDPIASSHAHAHASEPETSPLKTTHSSPPNATEPMQLKPLIENAPHDTETIETDSPIERIRAIQNKTELHQALLDDHQQFTRYPAYNQRFESEDSDPVMARYAVDERSTENPEDGSQLTIWSDKKYYLKGDQAKLYATLRDQEGRPIQTQFMAQVIYNEQTNLQTFSFEDTNQDGLYEYALNLNGENGQSWQAGVYKVLIVNKANPVSDALTFIISQPDIELTGQFRDTVSSKGELIIEAEVRVDRENRYYLQASLYSANQIAIGATQQSLQLPPGKHWVKLAFDAALIKDSGESSPFLLKHLSLAKVSLPIQRAPIIETEYFTREYPEELFQAADQTKTTEF